jgi:hypothetical protein
MRLKEGAQFLPEQCGEHIAAGLGGVLSTALHPKLCSDRKRPRSEYDRGPVRSCLKVPRTPSSSCRFWVPIRTRARTDGDIFSVRPLASRAWNSRGTGGSVLVLTAGSRRNGRTSVPRIPSPQLNHQNLSGFRQKGRFCRAAKRTGGG